MNRNSVLVFSGAGWHRGVLATARDRGCHRRTPALEEGGEVSSGRSIPGFHLLDALDSTRELFAGMYIKATLVGLTMPAQHVHRPGAAERHAAGRSTLADLQLTFGD